jgi:nitrate reductase delta subunit
MNHGYVALARLIGYPDERLLGEARAIGAVLDPCFPGHRLGRWIDELVASDPIEVQQEYVATFDRGRRTSLNLFEHVHGESRDRGQAMVDLIQVYRRAGLEPASRELPDYLPVFLEYLAVLDADAAREELREIAAIVRSIAAALGQRGSRWLAPFELLLDLAGEPRVGDALADTPDRDADIDADWDAAAVRFLGACAPPPSEQPIQFVRRT